MTTLEHGSALRRPSSGGIASRRPLIRWAWRLFRREWRQQILVVALLTVAVAAAISSVGPMIARLLRHTARATVPRLISSEVSDCLRP